MMKLQDVIDRAVKDPIFAAELAGKVGRAARSGTTRESIRGEAWTDALNEFAETPEELARLVATADDETSPWWTTTITTTTLTTTTMFCTTTTTTSVTTTLTGTLVDAAPE
jgi:hypothetical protein